MTSDKWIKMLIDIIGFPFSLTNLFLQKKSYVKEIGQKIQIQDRSIHTVVSGEENTDFTVIFDAGMSCCSLDWYEIQPQVSQFARVLSFDRAGYGWSSPRRKAYTSEDVVHDLKYILQELNIKPPYILVGHSFGSLNMRLFASLYPDEVASLILIDPIHENRYISEEWDAIRKKSHQKNLAVFRFGYLTSGLGLPKLLKQPIGRKYLSESLQAHVRYVGYHPKSYEAVYRELLYSETSALQVKHAKPLPANLSVTIISSNNTDETWVQQQNMLCKLTKNTTQIKTNNHHSIHLENPNVVIEAIKEAIHHHSKIVS